VSHTFGNILLHIIFSTHGRCPLIKPGFRTDLFAYLGGIVREMDGTALIINGTPTTFTCWCGFGPLSLLRKSRAS
jgi:hypothetical protein